LLLSREFSKDNEEGNLEECGLLCELLNGVASVLKDTFVSIDVGNFRDLIRG
jgi:hypothetical protein